jgi:phosphate-selective porin
MHLSRVRDDDEVASVNVRGVFRSMLAPQDVRHFGRKPPKRLTRRIDDVPLALYF